MQNSGRQIGNKTTILVAKEKKLVALATVLVAISSPASFRMNFQQTCCNFTSGHFLFFFFKFYNQ